MVLYWSWTCIHNSTPMSYSDSPIQSTHATQWITCPINARHTAIHPSNQRTPHSELPIQSTHVTHWIRTRPIAHATQRITRPISPHHTADHPSTQHTPYNQCNQPTPYRESFFQPPSNQLTPYSGSSVQSTHAIQRITHPISPRHTTDHPSNQRTSYSESFV